MDAVAAHPSAPVLELTGIHKQFAGIPVLRDVQLRLYPGEIHALMGQNGAGKSTLIKVLTGVIKPSGGQMQLGGEPVWPDCHWPHSALASHRVRRSTSAPPLGGREHLCRPLSALRHRAGLPHRLGSDAPALARAGGAHRAVH